MQPCSLLNCSNTYDDLSWIVDITSVNNQHICMCLKKTTAIASVQPHVADGEGDEDHKHMDATVVLET